MPLKSLGLIETKGLAVAIEAADTAVKSANVELLGYELSRGGGWTTIKLQGDVGAVKAAIDAAKSVALRMNGYVSARVIPRPSESLRSMLFNAETVGCAPTQPEKVVQEQVALPVEEVIEPTEIPPVESAEATEELAEKVTVLDEQPEVQALSSSIEGSQKVGQKKHGRGTRKSR